MNVITNPVVAVGAVSAFGVGSSIYYTKMRTDELLGAITELDKALKRQEEVIKKQEEIIKKLEHNLNAHRDTLKSYESKLNAVTKDTRKLTTEGERVTKYLNETRTQVDHVGAAVNMIIGAARRPQPEGPPVAIPGTGLRRSDEPVPLPGARHDHPVPGPGFRSTSEQEDLVPKGKRHPIEPELEDERYDSDDDERFSAAADEELEQLRRTRRR